MEKFFVRFKGGYLNLNNDTVCITTTGNWQETHGLKQLVSNWQLRKKSIILWIIILTVVGVSILLKSYFILALLTLLLVLNYWKPINSSFKIPIAKIFNLQRLGNTLTLHFYNEAGKPVIQKFRKINDSDFEAICKAIHLDNIRDRNSTLLP